MARVYVVVETVGNYDSTDHRLVCAFTDEMRANEFATRANELDGDGRDYNVEPVGLDTVPVCTARTKLRARLEVDCVKAMGHEGPHHCEFDGVHVSWGEPDEG